MSIHGFSSQKSLLKLEILLNLFVHGAPLLKQGRLHFVLEYLDLVCQCKMYDLGLQSKT